MAEPNTPTPKKKASLVALIGAGCTAALCNFLPTVEGTIYRGYKDPIGIVTACTGHTLTAVLGRPYTPAECESLLVMDLIDHAEPVLKCTPGLRSQPYPLTAAISFTFNVGEHAYCNSTMARKFNAGDIAGACAELSKWIYAGGKVLPGLVTRREKERAICEGRLEVGTAANDAWWRRVA